MLALEDLVVARDFTPVSNRALHHAFDLAARAQATLHVLTAEVLHQDVTEPGEPPSPAADLDRVQGAVEHETDVSGDAIDDVPIEEAKRRDVGPAPAILNYASENDVDLIALGTRGEQEMKRALLGSVAEQVVRRAERPVLTVRGGEVNHQHSRVEEIRRILIPLDFSEHSREALFYAREWANLYDAQVDVLHIIKKELHPIFQLGGAETIYDVEPDVDEKALKKIDAFVEDTSGPSVETEYHVTSGSASSGIVQFVDEHPIDLTVLSTHGRTGVKRFFLGSVAEKVVRHVDCPVLTVKAFGKSLVSSSPPGQR